MKAMKVLGTVLAIGLGLSAVTSASDVYAQGKGKAKKEAPAPAAAAEAPDTKKPIVMDPSDLAWGMSPKQVAEVVDKVIHKDYDAILAKTATGSVNARSLELQREENKNAFRRSRIDFGKLPTGIDATPLRGEYTYLNKESMMTLTRNGQNRYFFFIQDKLWKVIDEVKLGEGVREGKTWEEAVLKLVKKYGVPGRIQEADYDKGRNATEVDWKDTTTHIRAIQRGEAAVALAYEDRATLSNLPNLRQNKPAATDDIDPAVAAAIRGSKAPEPPPPAPDKAGAKKK